MKMHTGYSQRGWSSLSLLLVIVIAAFFLMCAFKLVPAYAENHYIVTGLKQLADDPEGLAKKTNAQIIRDLNSYYTINNVRSAGAKEIDITRNSRGVVIVNQYEERIPLLANIDVVLRFHNVLDSSNPDDCCKPPE
ncbi:MAG TPA: DUF4845 domain-containing protein [Cellvibrionaceae bacterium]